MRAQRHQLIDASAYSIVLPTFSLASRHIRQGDPS
jgi:hypothetical protein